MQLARRICLAFGCCGMFMGCYGDGVMQIAGVVVDHQQNPIPEASVTLTISHNQKTTPLSTTAITDDDGTFSVLQTFAPGRPVVGRLIVNVPGFDEQSRNYGPGTHFNEVIVLQAASEQPPQQK